MNILCLDFDEVMIKTEHIIAKLMGEVIPVTSIEYQYFMKKSYECGLITEKEYNDYLREYRDYRNQFLEEVYEKYIGLIDYKKIYVPDNFFPDTLKNVKELCHSDKYDGVYITTHYNVEREKKCKEELIRDCFPAAKYIPIKFFVQKYEPGIKRTRTCKADYIKRILNFSTMEKAILIDDSSTNIQEMNDMGGIGIQYIDKSVIAEDKKNNDEFLTSLDPFEIERKVKEKKLTLHK